MAQASALNASSRRKHKDHYIDCTFGLIGQTKIQNVYHPHVFKGGANLRNALVLGSKRALSLEVGFGVANIRVIPRVGGIIAIITTVAL